MKFEIGIHETRGGHVARVEFVVREPYTTVHPLIGQVLVDDTWVQDSWDLDGFNIGPNSETPYDLMPAVVKKWKAYDKYGMGTGWDADRDGAIKNAPWTPGYLESADFCKLTHQIIPGSIKVEAV